jgi:hypothetical protein
MKFAAAVLVCLLFCTPATRAQQAEKRDVGRVGHYIRTHKELLVADTIIVLAEGADAASSVHCQRTSPNCVERNSTVGSHPSNAVTWGYAAGTAAALLTGEHLLWWLAKKVDPGARHLVVIAPIASGVTEYWSVSGNVDAANRLAAARSRLMMK